MVDPPAFQPSRGAKRTLQSLVVLGAGALAVGLWLAPQRTWANLLLVNFYLLGLGLGGLVFMALHHVTAARWSAPLRRVPEAMSTVLPVAAVGLAAVFLFRPSLYAWSAPGFHGGAESPLRHLWLNRPFFLLRALTYLALWLAFAAAFARTFSRYDGERASPMKPIGLSAAFLVVFGFTCWLASHDWIMSLEPEWASTMFGIYNFAGLFLSGLAAITLLVIWLGPRDPMQTVVTKDSLHDLGTLLFAFSSFWMYVWFFQYMLIWYVNKPEETAYFLRRRQGIWPALLLLDLILNWGIPFLVLLFRSAKRNPRVLGTIAFLVLLGRWIDLYVMIFPFQADAGRTPGPIEGGLLLGAAGVFVLAVFNALGKTVAKLAEPS